MSSQGFRSWGGAAFAILTAAVLTVTGALTVGRAGSASTIKIENAVAGEPDVNWVNSNFVFDGTNDQVTAIGHNAGNGGREDTSKPGLWLQQELKFDNGPNQIAEFFGQWTAADGSPVLRPIGFTVDYATELASWGLNGAGDWLDTPGNQRGKFFADGTVAWYGAGTTWFVGQGRPLISASKNDTTSSELFRTSFLARTDTGSNGDVVQFDSPQGFELRIQSPVQSFYAGNLVRGYVNATSWFMLHQFRKGYVFTPTALSGDVNDYNPTNLDISMVLRISGGAANRNITGISATNSDGASEITSRSLTIHNIGTTNNLVLVHESASSSAANRFDLPSAANVTILPRASVSLLYDETLNRWFKENMVIPVWILPMLRRRRAANDVTRIAA